MMEEGRVLQRRLMCSFHLCLCLAALLPSAFFTHCGASRELSSIANPPPPPPPNPRKSDEKLNALMKLLLDMVRPLDENSQQPSGTNSEPYGVNSPFTLPPYDSLAPIPLPQNTPPFCIYPSPPPGPPGPTNPTLSPPAIFSPSFPYPNPNPSPSSPTYNPTPMPPAIVVPSPPEYIPSPTYVPSPSIPVFNPPSPSSGGGRGGGGGGGGGGGFVPSPPIFLPPIVYPPPAVPPPPYTAPTQTMWCVAKPAVPGPIIQEALNYACASGAECSQIQPGGPCYEPNTLIAHASYAFNSYWQRTKVAGGTCGFGGIAILVTVDPSHDGCHFMYA